MKLSNIKLFSQKDPRWASKKLGTSTIATISSDGCLLCDVATVLNYHGKEITPDRLNDDITRVKGWYQGARLIYGAITDIYPDIIVDWDNYIDTPDMPAPLNKIDAILASGRIPLVKVDSDIKTSKLDEHWVCIIGKDEAGSYIIADPIDGSEQFFQARYGDPARYIFKIVCYSGPIKEVMGDAESLVEKVKDLSSKLADEIRANGELRVSLVGLQADLKEQEEDNRQLLEDNRKAELDKQNTLSDLKKMTDQYQESEKHLQAVLEQLAGLRRLTIDDIPTDILVKELLNRFFRKK